MALNFPSSPTLNQIYTVGDTSWVWDGTTWKAYSISETVSLTGAGTTVVTGSFPNFTITSDDQFDGTVTSVGGTGTVSGLTLSGTVTNSGNLTLGGSLSLTSGNVTTALGFTPYNATNPSGYTTNVGTVTTVAALTIGTTGTDLSSTVANGTTTPVITLNVPTASATNRGVLSAADWTTFNNKTSNVGTVTSVGGTGTVSGLSLSGTVTTSGNLTLSGTLAVTASNFSSQLANTFLSAPNGSAGVPTFRTIVAADVPTLNQNTTGSAATLTTGRTISLTGDVTYTSGSFDGSTNVTGTSSLSNTGVTSGSYGSATDIPVINIDAKGRITTASTVSVSIPSGALTFIGDVTGTGTTGSSTSLTLASVGTVGTYTKVTTDAKGRVTSGTTLSATDIPSLDASKITSGTIDAARLPSYVDDVIEGANLAAFPGTGEAGKIYVALDTNKTYRWSGSAYVYITSGAVDSVAGKTGVVTLVKGDVGLGNVDNTADSAKSVASAAVLTTPRTISGVSFDGSANITLNTSGITENTNLYYTDTRSRSALSFIAGSGAYNSTTGVITIPTNTNQLTNGAGFTTNTGTVTSVSGTGTIAGLSLSGTVTTSGNLTLSGTLSTPVNTINDSTTVGQNFVKLINPSAITFPRINADNTISTLDAASFRTAIGAGTSSTTGTVTSVGGTGTVSGLSLSGTVTTSGNLTLGGTLAVTASNFASQTANTFLSAPNASAGVPTFRTIVAADIPTLNQNTTGTASNVSGTVAIANGGTGQTTKAAAFNALSPITSTGDLIIGNGANSATRLAIGTNGQVLTSNGTTATWSTAPTVSAATSTALGTVYGQTLSTDNSTVSIGYNSGIGTGLRNAALGTYAGEAMSTGADNAYIGFGSGRHATGSYNTVLGANAYSWFATGSSNVGIGYNVFGAFTSSSGSNNVAIGQTSLAANTSGANNTAVGHNSGSNITTGANNIVLGYNSTASSATVSNENTFGNSSSTSNRFWGDFKMGGSSAGTSGQVLTSAGAGVAPTWTTISAGAGTVTSVSALTIGTTGTDVSSTVANSTTTPVITLNIPTASATNRGVLSSADWTTFNNKGSGTVTSVTGTAPVVSSGGTTPAISMAAATASVNGYMTSTYASKLDGIATGATANTGTVTSIATTGTVSGLTLTGGPITATGTITLGGTLAVTASNFASQTMNTVLAAPQNADGVPTFRNIHLSDMPSAWIKRACNAATTAALTLNTAQTTIDGVTLSATSRVLVKNQATASQNGIYTNVTTTTWVRATDADASSDIAGAFVNVDAGTVNGGKVFDTDFKSTDTLGTTAMNWYQNVDAGYLTTVGNSFATLTNPSAITFPRINADNTISALDAATFRTAIGAGTSSTTGTVTGVTATAPVVSSGGTAPVISMAAATTTVNGYLTSTDWNTFNGKQAALVSGTNIKTIGGVTLLGSGDITGLATTAGNLSQFAATTSAQLLGVISDETGSGALVFGTSPAITTSLTTSSASFDLINTNATTVNFAKAATALSIGASTGTTTVNNGLIVTGDLTVNGTTTTINATTISVDDKNIELGSVATPTNTTADGGGITLKGATDKTFNWVNATSAWTSSEDLNLLTGKVYEINGVTVLSSTTLGSGVTASSLTSVGTITSGTWSGSFGAVSGANLTGLTAGNLSGTIPSAVLGNSTLYIGTTAIALNRATASQTLTGVSIDGNAGTVTSITSLQVTTALGFTPYNATNPSGYTTNTGTVTSVAALTLGTTGTDVSSTVATGTTTPVITLNIPTASATNRGALSSADWTTFNNKYGSGSSPSFAGITDTGNLTFTGSSNRIIGDFTAASTSVNFQTSVANSPTYVSAIPSGTNRFSGYLAWNDNTISSTSSWGGFIVNDSSFDIKTDKSASGTYLPMTFSTGGSERLRITSAGGISFGATGTAYGTTGQVLTSQGNGTPVWANASGGGATVTDDTTTNATRYLVWEDITSGTATTMGVSSTKLYFNPSTGDLSATNFNSLSDATFKTNVKQISNSDQVINDLLGVEFDWVDGTGSSYGFIAQDLEKVLKHAVTTNSDGIKTVNYSAVIPFLVEALKNQQKTINKQEDRLSRLESIINKL